MPRLNKFSSLFPDITVRVTSSAQFENLQEQHIDLAIRFGSNAKHHTESNLQCDYFGEGKVYPVCSAGLAQSMQFTKAEDLLNTWLVSLDNPGCYDWPTWFEHNNGNDYQNHQQWTQVHSTDMSLNAVSNGHGVTLAASYLCQEQLASGQLVIPINIAHPNVVKRYFVYQKDSAKFERIKLFCHWLKQEMDAYN